MITDSPQDQSAISERQAFTSVPRMALGNQAGQHEYRKRTHEARGKGSALQARIASASTTTATGTANRSATTILCVLEGMLVTEPKRVGLAAAVGSVSRRTWRNAVKLLDRCGRSVRHAGHHGHGNWRHIRQAITTTAYAFKPTFPRILYPPFVDMRQFLPAFCSCNPLNLLHIC